MKIRNARTDLLAQIVIFLAAGALAENYTEISKKITYSHYEGILGKASITLELQITFDSVASGYYTYHRYGKPISIYGIKKGDSLQFKEFDQNADSEGATFYGQTIDGHFRGDWIGKKHLNFNLTEDYSRSADSTLLRELDLYPSSTETHYVNEEEDVENYEYARRQVFFNADSILVSYSENDGEFSQAGHLIHTARYSTIDLRTKKVVDLFDIIRRGSEDVLWRAIQKRLEIDDEADQSYRIQSNYDSHFLTSKGLGLHFYRGSGQYGEDVFMPFEAIPRSCLNPGFKLVEINHHDASK